MTASEQERLATLETANKYMTEKIDGIDKKVDELNTKFDSVIEKLDSKFASKWVEWVVKGLIGLILVAVFGAMISEVIKK